MMQMRNLQMNGGAIPGLSDEMIYIGNLAFPGSMFNTNVGEAIEKKNE